MHIRKIFHLCGVVFLTTANVMTKGPCISFKTQVGRSVPSKDGYNVTLTFSVANTCPDRKSQLKSAKVYGGEKRQYPHPLCHVRYLDGACVMPMGCVCNTPSHSVSVHRHVNQAPGDSVWTLEGELTDGATINETIVISPDTDTGKSTATFPLTIVVSAAVCGVVVIINVVILVCCLRRKARASRTSFQLAHTNSGRPLPQQPPPARAHNSSGRRSELGQSSRQLKGASIHSYDYMDVFNSGAQVDAATTAAAGSGSCHGHTTTKANMYDADGYLLSDPAPSEDTG